MRVLVVEDDAGIASGLAASLRHAGYAVDMASTLQQAWASLVVESFDVMLLDLGLPDGEGLDLLARLRHQPTAVGGEPHWPTPDMPVLIMTARDGVSDRIRGLDSGADDYLTKPFDSNELLARLRAMFRRAAGRSQPLIHHGELALDPAARTVHRNGESVPLGPREFALLLALLQASPNVLSRARLEAALYSFDHALDSNAIEVHVHHLRRKLGEGLIRTVRGVGYCIPRESAASAS